MRNFFATPFDPLLTFLRLALAVVMFPHGAQKVLGWFGGGGFDGTMAFFTNQMGIPTLFAFLAILAEFGGSLALALGFLSRLSAFGVFCVMAVATFLVHLPNGFFMNWQGTQAGEGYEFHLLAMALSIAVIVRGGGAFSVDRWIVNRWYEEDQPEIRRLRVA